MKTKPKVLATCLSLSVCVYIAYTKMAEANFSQDKFSCSVCLDLLKNPVTIPCGHSYCISCITDCWNHDDQTGVYRCPQCRHIFTSRPALYKNVMFAEAVEELKKKKLQTAPPDHRYAGPGDVECDICTGRKYKAVKSCLECLNSYCQNHLDQHEKFFQVNKHNLMDPTRQLHEMICPKHRKHLEIYCRTDQQCICYLCVMDEHKNHETVGAAAERTKKQRLLGATQRKVQQKIQEREKEIQDLRETIRSHKRTAQTAIMDSDRIFTELIRSIERRRSEVTQLIRDQEKTAVNQAEGLLKQLEQEISDLRRKDAELKQLSQTDNHIHYLQSFQSLSTAPESDVSHNIALSSLLCFDDVRKSVYQLKDKLEDFCKDEIKKMSDGDSRQFTLDSYTMNKYLWLSDGNRVATNTKKIHQYPDHPDKFDYWEQVLCKESVSGRCYWEVEWSGNDGVHISVTYKSISRKGNGYESVFGCNNQSWSLLCSPSRYSFEHNNIWTDLSVSSSCSKIGVYVDHSAGTLALYSVSDTMTLIHRVQTTFTQPLYPGFYVNKGSTVKMCHLTQ